MVRALLNTLAIIVSVPFIGYIIGVIVDFIILGIHRRLGNTITMLIANRLTFLGTVHHELSHAMFATLSGAKVIKVDLFYPSGHTLGNVQMYTRGPKLLKSFQLMITAAAPIITGLISTYLLIFHVLTYCTQFWQSSLIIYLIFSILIHMTMSKQDIKNYVKGIPVCSIAIFIILYIFKIDILTLLNIM